METNEKSDMKIVGSGNPAGGDYNKMKMTGEGDVVGNLECERLKALGDHRVDGDVKAGKARMIGNSRIQGDFSAEETTIIGETHIDGQARVEILRDIGNIEVGGNVTGEDIRIRGNLSAEGDCEAETFTAKGMFTINGLLNAEYIKIRLHHADSTAKEIGGENVEVKAGIHLFKSSRPVRLSAGTIEGNDIDLENTKAKVVRGHHVRIGPGCEIDLVEYRGDFKQDENAEVKANQRI